MSSTKLSNVGGKSREIILLITFTLENNNMLWILNFLLFFLKSAEQFCLPLMLSQGEPSEATTWVRKRKQGPPMAMAVPHHKAPRRTDEGEKSPIPSLCLHISITFPKQVIRVSPRTKTGQKDLSSMISVSTWYLRCKTALQLITSVLHWVLVSTHVSFAEEHLIITPLQNKNYHLMGYSFEEDPFNGLQEVKLLLVALPEKKRQLSNISFCLQP